MSKLVRVISASMERISATFEDGLCGSINWSDVLLDTGVTAGKVRLDTVRPDKDGNLAVDYCIDPKAPDHTQVIQADKLYAILAKGENFKRVFTVDGQYGPITLAFTFIGQDKMSQATELEVRDLTAREVQYWYTLRGWPKAGCINSLDWRGRIKACWQLV